MRYFALGMVILILGCQAPAYTPAVHFTLDTAVEVPRAETSDRSLGIRPLEAAMPYKQKIAYRTGPFELKHYDGFEWAEMPRDMVTRALTDALVATGRFRDVGNALDLNAPDWILTGELRKFDEVHTADPWAAECEVRLELREALGDQAIWAATLSSKKPLEQNHVSALPSAMSRAVADIVLQAAAAIAGR